LNTTVDCKTIVWMVLPLCTDPDCASVHAPITAGNNAVAPTEELIDGVKARLQNEDNRDLWCALSDWSDEVGHHCS